MSHLKSLEHESIYILREAFARVKPLGMLWSIGKDSTVLLHMARKAFYGKVPFPLIMLDTGLEFPEVYDFRDRLVGEWSLDLRVSDCPPESEMDQTLAPAARAASRKTEGLKRYLASDTYKGLIVGIRRDEQSMRGKERIFSPRNETGGWDYKGQPAEFWGQYTTDVPEGSHLRIHPLLSWTELDIWRYTKQENIPFVPLYLSRNGKRFRSLGESNITFPVDSHAASLDDIIHELHATRTPERAGRSIDHETEAGFEKLRLAGYM